MDIPISATSKPNAPYSRRAPSPPFIPVARTCVNQLQGPPTITPSFSAVDPGTLSEDDLQILTGGLEQIAVERSVSWTYPMRHAAQSILDFLYVGPRPVVKDTEWLSARGITMVVLAHDVGFGATIGKFAERFTAGLGIEMLLVPVASAQDLVASFDDVIRAVSLNVVGVYRRSGGERKGKVLVTCQTGNDRSTVIAAAYLMSVFGVSMVEAVNFVMAQRFCANFDEECKRILCAWEEILQARKDVYGARPQRDAVGAGPAGAAGAQGGGVADQSGGGKKRRIEDTRDEDDMDIEDAETHENMDADRYYGRDAFMPFIDGLSNISGEPDDQMPRGNDTEEGEDYGYMSCLTTSPDGSEDTHQSPIESLNRTFTRRLSAPQGAVQSIVRTPTPPPMGTARRSKKAKGTAEKIRQAKGKAPTGREVQSANNEGDTFQSKNKKAQTATEVQISPEQAAQHNSSLDFDRFQRCPDEGFSFLRKDAAEMYGQPLGPDCAGYSRGCLSTESYVALQPYPETLRTTLNMDRRVSEKWSLKHALHVAATKNIARDKQLESSNLVEGSIASSNRCEASGSLEIGRQASLTEVGPANLRQSDDSESAVTTSAGNP
ncbi:uncharacterized protein DNG_01605 [Cephalotrichum gorgonifer]|uniref:Tyrosine specific protein phosphatases domain-containing protein n=1 Tax=Cephalotrichum gorgonifer TaxID=2041049 RepID=A0AAE8MS18_9PEZI|nr:uncharacterized protein DNG_01605 [Cephalotrichum gorgonifer]